MRALTDSDVLVADKLFATLDTTVRMLSPAVEPTILVSDTVGFLKDLPHGLVASFKSTLEEALEASLLLHIVDASADDFDDQLKTTEQVLAEIEAGDIPTILVFNKVDLIKDPTRLELLKNWPDALKVSAFSEPDVSLVHQKVCEFFFGEKIERWLVLRHDQGALRSELYDNCEVLEEISDHDGIKIRVLGHRFHRVGSKTYRRTGHLKDGSVIKQLTPQFKSFAKLIEHFCQNDLSANCEISALPLANGELHISAVDKSVGKTTSIALLPFAENDAELEQTPLGYLPKLQSQDPTVKALVQAIILAANHIGDDPDFRP